MRLALIGPVYPYRGGIAHYTTMLFEALVELEHEVLVVSFKRQYPQWLFPGQSDRDPSEGPMMVGQAHYWIDSMNPFTWLRSFRRILKYQPDAVILQWWTVFWVPVWLVLGILTRLFLRGPLIFICHNVLPHEANWWDPWLTRLVLWWGTQLIVHSIEEEQRLLSLLPNTRTVVIPLPIFDLFDGRQLSKEEARGQLDLPMDVPILLFFGIVREYKGLKDLLAALPSIKAHLGEVILLIAGEFWEDKRPYLEIIEELKLGDSVVIDDRYIPNEEVSLYLSAADVLVAPYRQVTGSAVVQAARGSGCPVITTRTGSLGEVEYLDTLGKLAEPANSESLAEAVIQYYAEGLHRLPRERGTADEGPKSWEQLVSFIEKAARCESPSC